MKLFEEFDAVRFPEENLIFITNRGYIYYIYNPKYDYWRKHRNAGNDHITVSNYRFLPPVHLSNGIHVESWKRKGV